jgi:hypothetical protein
VVEARLSGALAVVVAIWDGSADEIAGWSRNRLVGLGGLGLDRSFAVEDSGFDDSFGLGDTGLKSSPSLGASTREVTSFLLTARFSYLVLDPTTVNFRN